jgi:glutathione peroxidase
MASAFDFSFTALDGSALPLARFEGRPVFVVNTASECGFTPQYGGLQKLWRAYKGRGLVVLGVPSNDFGGQEPGDEGRIAEFCRTRFGIDFPMTAKHTVTGGAAHPFYRWIAAELGDAAVPRWNFHKYLIGRDGAVVGVWPSAVSPQSREISAAIGEALAAPAANHPAPPAE